MTAPMVVILAGGLGTRMRSATPKLAHDLCGRPLLAWPVAAAREAGCERVVVVVGRRRAPPIGELGEGVDFAVQEQPLGTADALAAAAELIARDAVVLVVSGDVPLVEASLLASSPVGTRARAPLRRW